MIEIERAKKDPTYYLRVINPEAKAALEGLYQEYKAPVSEQVLAIATFLLFFLLGKEREN